MTQPVPAAALQAVPSPATAPTNSVEQPASMVASTPTPAQPAAAALNAPQATPPAEVQIQPINLDAPQANAAPTAVAAPVAPIAAVPVPVAKVEKGTNFFSGLLNKGKKLVEDHPAVAASIAAGGLGVIAGKYMNTGSNQGGGSNANYPVAPQGGNGGHGPGR